MKAVSQNFKSTNLVNQTFIYLKKIKTGLVTRWWWSIYTFFSSERCLVVLIFAPDDGTYFRLNVLDSFTLVIFDVKLQHEKHEKKNNEKLKIYQMSVWKGYFLIFSGCFWKQFIQKIPPFFRIFSGAFLKICPVFFFNIQKILQKFWKYV